MNTTKITSLKNVGLLETLAIEIKLNVEDKQISEVLLFDSIGNLRGSKPEELTDAQYKEALKVAFNNLIDEMRLF